LSGVLDDSPVLWNRRHLDLESAEIVAQFLDRGTVAEWHELYERARADVALRRRILQVVARVPLPYPGFWLAALASLGEVVDWELPFPEDRGI
jgi:hypothetical protein